MKSNTIPLIGALIGLGVLGLAGCKPGSSEDETKAPTEVAVEVGKVTRATLRAWVDAYGTVEGEPAGGGNPAGAVKLSAPTTGIVMTVPAKEGERVEAGAVIVKLDDRLALANLALAEQQFERQQKLRKVEGTSEKAFQEASQQLAAAKAQLAMVQLTSPIGGVVARIHVQPGQAVDSSTVIAEVIDPARLVATLSVPAAEAALLKAGQTAELLLERSANIAAQGKVLYVSPQVNEQTATVLVRAFVPANAGLRAGQFVHARLITEERANKLAVPREALYTDHTGNSTLSLVDGDLARQRPVKVGLRDGNLVEVEGEGIAEGATVVTLGSYALPQETKIHILNTAKEEVK